MKDKKLKKLIQKPLRFHHQDIHEELDTIRDLLVSLSVSVNAIRTTLRETRGGCSSDLDPRTDA